MPCNFSLCCYIVRSPTTPASFSMEDGGIRVTPSMFGGRLPTETPSEFIDGMCPLYDCITFIKLSGMKNLINN